MSYAIINVDPLELVAMLAAIPEPLVWPDGASSHAVGVGFSYGSWKIVNAEMDRQPHSYCYEDGVASISLSDDVLSIKRNWPPLSLESVQASLCRHIDESAEALRSRLVTIGVGQDMVYRQKLKEAEDFVASSNIDESKYPMIAASCREGESLKSAADRILKAHSDWVVSASKIEAIRLGSKERIMVSQSVMAAVAASETAIWE